MIYFGRYQMQGDEGDLWTPACIKMKVVIICSLSNSLDCSLDNTGENRYNAPLIRYR